MAECCWPDVGDTSKDVCRSEVGHFTCECGTLGLPSLSLGEV